MSLSRFRNFTILLLLGINFLTSPQFLYAQSSTMNLGPKTTGVYYGLATGEVHYKQDFTNQHGSDVQEQIEVNSAELRSGVSYNRWVSVEARLGSVDKDSTRIGYSDTEASLDIGSYQNFLLKVKYPSYVQPYALLGMSHTEMELCQGSGCDSSLDWRTTYGGGLLLPLRGDYTSGIYFEALSYDESSEESRNNADIEHLHFGFMVGF